MKLEICEYLRTGSLNLKLIGFYIKKCNCIILEGTFLQFTFF